LAGVGAGGALPAQAGQAPGARRRWGDRGGAARDPGARHGAVRDLAPTDVGHGGAPASRERARRPRSHVAARRSERVVTQRTQGREGGGGSGLELAVVADHIGAHTRARVGSWIWTVVGNRCPQRTCKR